MPSVRIALNATVRNTGNVPARYNVRVVRAIIPPGETDAAVDTITTIPVPAAAGTTLAVGATSTVTYSLDFPASDGVTVGAGAFLDLTAPSVKTAISSIVASDFIVPAPPAAPGGAIAGTLTIGLAPPTAVRVDGQWLLRSRPSLGSTILATQQARTQAEFARIMAYPHQEQLRGFLRRTAPVTEQEIAELIPEAVYPYQEMGGMGGNGHGGGSAGGSMDGMSGMSAAQMAQMAQTMGSGLSAAEMQAMQGGITVGTPTLGNVSVGQLAQNVGISAAQMAAMQQVAMANPGMSPEQMAALTGVSTQQMQQLAQLVDQLAGTPITEVGLVGIGPFEQFTQSIGVSVEQIAAMQAATAANPGITREQLAALTGVSLDQMDQMAQFAQQLAI